MKTKTETTEGDWTLEALQPENAADEVYTGEQLWGGERPHFRTEAEAEAAAEKLREEWAALDPHDKPWGTPRFEVVNARQLPYGYLLW